MDSILNTTLYQLQTVSVSDLGILEEYWRSPFSLVFERCFLPILTASLHTNNLITQQSLSLPFWCSTLIISYCYHLSTSAWVLRFMIFFSCFHMRQVNNFSRCNFKQALKISTDLLRMVFKMGACEGFVSHHPIPSLCWYNTDCTRCIRNKLNILQKHYILLVI